MFRVRTIHLTQPDALDIEVGRVFGPPIARTIVDRSNERATYFTKLSGAKAGGLLNRVFPSLRAIVSSVAFIIGTLTRTR